MVAFVAASTCRQDTVEGARFSRGFTIWFRASVVGLPPPVRRLTVSLTVLVGKAARRTAMAPATCGVACEVPYMVAPAAVMAPPGASMVRNEAELEKQVTLSAAVDESLQAPKETPPKAES